jgi:hypothetical protein
MIDTIRDALLDEAELIQFKMDNFCDDCDDPVISHECEEIWGRIERWTVIDCQKGDRCRRLAEFEALEDALEAILRQIGEVA